MNQHEKIVSLLTEWDTLQEKRSHKHNHRFLGIALNSLASVEEDFPNADAKKIVVEAFNGKCAAFILKGLGIEFTPEEIR